MQLMKQKEQQAKKWALATLILLLFFLSLIIVINYINDPLWVFNHENFSNKMQLGFNERQQKTNRLYFDEKDYDSILLGNSKSTYINQNSFTNGRLFNYAVSAMRPEEFEGYINFFKAINKVEPNYILLGIDFATCTKNNDVHKFDDPRFYIKETTSRFYDLKHLLSYSTFGYSLRNLTQGLSKQKAVYFHDNSKIKIGFDKEYDEDFDSDLKELRRNAEIYRLDVAYNPQIMEVFNKLKERNKNSEFIIIFLPDFMPYFTVNSNKNIYKKCLADFGKIFGKKNIFNFMELNATNTNPNNYYDNSHFRSEIGDMIMQTISEKLNKIKPKPAVKIIKA